MRPPVDRDRIEELARRLAPAARSATIVYLTGGASAVIEGWRQSTVDVDLRFEPDSDELLRELPKLKDQLQVNIELASPPDFIPELPGWRERSGVIFTVGNVQVRHFDLYSQALAKIERGFQQDLQRQLPEGGKTRPTPGVHSDGLASIARNGLGVSRREAELG